MVTLPSEVLPNPRPSADSKSVAPPVGAGVSNS